MKQHPGVPPHFNTLTIHAGEDAEGRMGDVAPPMHLSSAFAFADAAQAEELFGDESRGYVYTRWANPTNAVLERKVAALEGGEAGLATASGLAAISTALLTAARSGEHVLASRALFGGSFTLLSQMLSSLGLGVSFIDMTEPSSVRAGVTADTRVVFFETPGNPALDVVDVTAVSELAHAAGALVIVDSTFATPFNQRPLQRGADVVVHSATKYLGGHGDVMGGLMVGGSDFIDRARRTMLRQLGGVMAPFNAWLTTRGVLTLAVRMERHNANALAIARWLARRPEVERVHYPGLEEHPGHATARRQMTGFGGVVAFELRGGLQAGRKLMNGVRLFTLAATLGDVRSIITHPASMTHAALPAYVRRQSGITDGLVRLSVGLEEVGDLMADLESALAQVDG